MAHGRQPTQLKIGDILLWDKNMSAQPRSAILPVHHASQERAQWRPILWPMGAAILATEHGASRSAVEVEGIQCVANIMTLTRRHGCWDNGWWHRDYTGIAANLKALRDLQTGDHGVTNLRWLPGSRILGHSLLIDDKGHGTVRAQINKIAGRGATVGDVVTWEWRPPEVVASSANLWRTRW